VGLSVLRDEQAYARRSAAHRDQHREAAGPIATTAVLNLPRRPLAMRGIIVLGIGLIIAAWIDHSYYGGLYGRATSDMIEHIAASFKH
jgi:hypothetical protein